MSEFEWRNEMRKLGGSVEPVRDLWPDIRARIDAAPRRNTRSFRGWAIAATILAACGVAALAWRVHTENAPAVPVASTDAVPLDQSVYVAAAQDLDDASSQLQQALEQRPDAVFLVGLINRTNSQRMRLLRQAPYAG